MKKTLKFVLFIIGLIVGYQLGSSIISAEFATNALSFFTETPTKILIFKLIISILIGFIFILFIPPMLKRQEQFINEFLSGVKNISVYQVITMSIGLILGLILAALICIPINLLKLPTFVNSLIAVAVYAGSIYACVTIAKYKYPEIMNLFKVNTDKEKDETKQKSKKNKKLAGGKILDTSVIIDGRIYDILKTGFVDGPIVIPEFVLFELQTIADSSDGIKRNRGRRGLDILNKIQNEIPVEVIITDKDYPNITEVDTKLLRLAADTNGKVVTNDYNLNKIAEFQGVTVLNTNELTNAVKTLVLPGEEMFVKVLREGKEHSQGIAYLEDGTMIVVEEGKHYIGQDINTIVTSVLQTAAGRMIFVKPI